MLLLEKRVLRWSGSHPTLSGTWSGFHFALVIEDVIGSPPHVTEHVEYVVGFPPYVIEHAVWFPPTFTEHVVGFSP